MIEKIIEPLPERPLASLYDIAVLYDACDRYEKLSALDWDMEDPESLRYMTPSESADLLDEPDSIVAAQVDLTGDEPRLDTEQPVVIERYTEDKLYKLGHSYWDKKAGRKTDYSISNHTGSSAKDVDTVAHDDWANRFLRGRFESWAQSDAASTVIEEADDRGVVAALRQLGNDTDAMERLEQAFLDTYENNEVSALVTVKVKFDDEEGYLYAGQVPELNSVAIEQKHERFRAGLSTDEAAGQGVGYVSGTDELVLGGTPGILGQYGKKRKDGFPNMNAKQSWQLRPLSEENAVAVSNFGSFIDDFGVKTGGVRFYHLPYPTQTVDADVFEWFYNNVFSQIRGKKGLKYIDAINNVLEETQEGVVDLGIDDIDTNDTETTVDGPSYSCRVYGLLVEMGNPNVTFFETENIDYRYLHRIADEYVDIVHSLSKSNSPFSWIDGLSYTTRPINFDDDTDQFNFLNGDTEHFRRALLFGQFLTGLGQPAVDSDETNADIGTTTPRISVSADVLRGELVSRGQLIDHYVNAIISEQRRRSGSKDISFPQLLVVLQLAQGAALERADALGGNTSIIDFGFKDRDVPSMTDDQDTRLERFLNSHAALDGDEAQAVFLTGALVGAITDYQDHPTVDVSQKIVDTYPISYMSKRNINEIVQGAIEKNLDYAQADDYLPMNSHYTSRIPDVILAKDRDDWELSSGELRWLYSLGIAYGLNDDRQQSNSATDSDNDDDANTGDNNE